MPVFRVHRNADYVVMCNMHLRDSRLSLKAKGLLSLLLSLPPDWDITIAGITAICKEGRRSVGAAFKELEECGYMAVRKMPPEDGNPRLRYVYDIFESPDVANLAQGCDSSTFCAAHNVQLITAQNKEYRTRGRGCVETEKDSHVDSSSKYDSLVGRAFVPPTVDEVRAYVSGNMLTRCDPELFCATYEAQGWVLGNGVPMADWQAAVRKWHAQGRNRDASERPADDFSDLNDGWRSG